MRKYLEISDSLSFYAAIAWSSIPVDHPLETS
jgi:hypothetical protein